MEPRTPRLYHEGEGSAAAATFTAFGSVGVVCAATATMLVAAVIASSLGASVMGTAVVAQLAMLLVPVIAAHGSGRTSEVLGLARPRGNRYFAAAALLGATAWYLNMRLVELLPVRSEDVRLVELIDRPTLPVVLAAVALAPAICEEVLFRGVLVRGLATRFYLPVAIGIGALVFSAYHLRVVQLVPTFTLGLALGYLAMRAGSAVPGMLAHVLNNTLALLVARGEVPPFANALATHPTLALVGCGGAAALGIVIASRGPGGDG